MKFPKSYYGPVSGALTGGAPCLRVTLYQLSQLNTEHSLSLCVHSHYKSSHHLLILSLLPGSRYWWTRRERPKILQKELMLWEDSLPIRTAKLAAVFCTIFFEEKEERKSRCHSAKFQSRTRADTSRSLSRSWSLSAPGRVRTHLSAARGQPRLF